MITPLHLRYLPVPLIALIYGYSMLWRPILENILLRNRWFSRKYLPALNPEYRHFLVGHFPFYNSLNDSDQILFEGRVQKFINLKEFIPRGGIREVTPMMKALVAGSAVKLTFGHPSVYFRHFRRILIYPENYFSQITGLYHKGEVHPAGIIVFSWNNLQQAFDDHGDGLHLGLHEMAHALRLIFLNKTHEFSFSGHRLIKAFDAEALKNIRRIRSSGTKSIFRDYALENLHEFFAVSVELFFERPNAYKENYPVLYKLLTRLLKVNPLQPS